MLFRSPTKPGQSYLYVHKIVAVQRTHASQLRYRVEVQDTEWPGHPGRDFGRVADPEGVVFKQALRTGHQ